jgi:ribosome biogenesis GTPase
VPEHHRTHTPAVPDPQRQSRQPDDPPHIPPTSRAQQRTTLSELGWSDALASAASAAARATEPNTTAPTFPARVARVDRSHATALGERGSFLLPTDVSGSALAVGDWVLIAGARQPASLVRGASHGQAAVERSVPGSVPDRDHRSCDAEPVVGARVVAVLPRHGSFRRESVDGTGREQIVATNVDVVLIVTAFDSRRSLRSIERYLVLAYSSGALPVVLCTKCDLAPDHELASWLAEVRAVSIGVDVIATSVATGEGIERLVSVLRGATPAVGAVGAVGAAGPRVQTAALLGLSGAGKSTLVNHLAASELLDTGEVRRDGKGRHTTTHRELLVLPGIGTLIDTPGMRAIGIGDAGVGIERTFNDLESLAANCRFSNCGHAGDAGCAIRAATEAGTVDEQRVLSWFKLAREQRRAESRNDARFRAEERLRNKRLTKEHRSRPGDRGRDDSNQPRGQRSE